MTQDDSDNPTCARCGFIKSAHHLANFSDGPNVGPDFLVCPTATFTVLEHGDSVATATAKPAVERETSCD